MENNMIRNELEQKGNSLGTGQLWQKEQFGNRIPTMKELFGSRKPIAEGTDWEQETGIS
jgi:hypothetical protein